MKTVLVIDDEPDIRDTTRLILEKNSYNVITAVDGDDCLKQLKKNNARPYTFRCYDARYIYKKNSGKKNQ